MAIRIAERNGTIVLQGNVNSLTSRFIQKHMNTIKCHHFLVIQDSQTTLDMDVIRHLQRNGISASLV